MNRADQYANALVSATRGKSATEAGQLIEHFVSFVHRRGHEKLLPRIADAYERLVAREEARETALIWVAHADEYERHRAEVAADLELLGASAERVRVVADPHAIGGYEVRAHGSSVDRTYKRRLISLFELLKRTS